MLDKQLTLDVSSYSSLYDIEVLKTHFLRQLTELCDFNFIYDELEKNYRLDVGRKAYSPIMMFKYLLLKDIYNLSDVDVVRASGLFNMELQVATTIFVVNMKRIMTLINQK